MVFTPKTWQDSPSTSTPITADELNRIEQGVASAHGDHGIISVPTSLDGLRSPEHRGTYGVRAYNLVDAPDAFGSNQLVNVTITVSASNLVSQTLKSGTVTAERTASGNDSFSPWRISVSSPSLSRIIVSPDYEASISEGELLIVPKSETFFDDFSDSTVGEFPDGWSRQWSDDGEAKIVSAPDTASGKALQLSSPTSTRYAVSFDAPGSGVRDAEILVRWKTNHDAQHLRPVLRGGGVLGSEDSISTFRTNPAGMANLPVTIGGSANLDNGGPIISLESDRWMLTRFRVFGADRIATKTWFSGQVEPSEWNHTRGGASIQDGWIGVQLPTSTNNPIYTIDWVSVTMDGGKALTGGV